jgi:hypothetical protein
MAPRMPENSARSRSAGDDKSLDLIVQNIRQIARFASGSVIVTISPCGRQS